MKDSILKLISDEFNKIPDTGIDIGDIGNSLGISVAKYLKENNALSDDEIVVFMFGMTHGIDLIDEDSQLTAVIRKRKDDEEIDVDINNL